MFVYDDEKAGVETEVGDVGVVQAWYAPGRLEPKGREMS